MTGRANGVLLAEASSDGVGDMGGGIKGAAGVALELRRRDWVSVGVDQGIEVGVSADDDS